MNSVKRSRHPCFRRAARREGLGRRHLKHLTCSSSSIDTGMPNPFSNLIF